MGRQQEREQRMAARHIEAGRKMGQEEVARLRAQVEELEASATRAEAERDEARAKCERLEWLVEVLEFFWPAWTGHGADRAVSRLWRWEPAMSELKATRKAAMAALAECAND